MADDSRHHAARMKERLQRTIASMWNAWGTNEPGQEFLAVFLAVASMLMFTALMVGQA